MLIEVNISIGSDNIILLLNPGWFAERALGRFEGVKSFQGHSGDYGETTRAHFSPVCGLHWKEIFFPKLFPEDQVEFGAGERGNGIKLFSVSDW